MNVGEKAGNCCLFLRSEPVVSGGEVVKLPGFEGERGGVFDKSLLELSVGSRIEGVEGGGSPEGELAESLSIHVTGPGQVFGVKGGEQAAVRNGVRRSQFTGKLDQFDECLPV